MHSSSLDPALPLRSCPCGSGKTYAACCGPLLEGQARPQTAEALMHSRYTAHVLQNDGYLLETWAPGYRPEALPEGGPPPRWLSLQIDGCSGGGAMDEEGSVSFRATYLLDGVCWVLRENSRFIRLAGRWYYQDGDAATLRVKVERNSACPCGSKRKYKHCCGR